jgi:superfamily II DNA or RNA helicase
MILDNSTEEKKIINWFKNETPEDIKFNIVTGYFTIGALYDFIQIVKDKSTEINIVFGDMLLDDQIDFPVDLLNGNIQISDTFSLPMKAKEVVDFLKKDLIKIKILEPNFCHAKVYLAVSNKSITKGYYVTGSSNLTEAGLGIKYQNNIELNIAGQPTDPQNGELKVWFDNLWNDHKAKDQLVNIDQKLIDVKQYLINLIENFYKSYTPEEIYYKILYELFKSQLDDKESPNFLREIGRLENSTIYQELYPFQQKGVISLIKMLEKFNGAILADAVGLGKTWSALANMKYYQNKGFETILIVPKKLHQNWQHYHKRQNSLFKDDEFDFVLRYHTDLQDERIESKQDHLTLDSFFQSNTNKLFIIDESHNLRNNKTGRYKYLLENLLNTDKNPNHKVLLLSATPINTSLNDIKNQFKMMVSDKNDGFKDYLGIRNLNSLFANAQHKFNEWRSDKNGTIEHLIQKLPEQFTTLADNLIIARTRKIITDLTFPKALKPINVYVTPEQIGTIENFEELFKKFPPNMAVYSPYLYLKKKGKVSVLDDEWQRDAFLVKMMYILLVKRLESSWNAFYLTLNKILEKSNNIYAAIQEYEKNKISITLDGGNSLFDEDEDDEYTVGKREIKLSDIEKDGNLKLFKDHIKEDINVMQQVIEDLKTFQGQVSTEKDYKSKDKKIEELISQINTKQSKGKNKKVLIFTTYRDTAYYLYDELKKRGFNKTAVVSGSDSMYAFSDEKLKKFEPILERFCPYTKLYIGKKWENYSVKKSKDDFENWKIWIKENDIKTQAILDEEIEILIATDCLSEGQNLQDCDFVVNYDIHWNPVRIIQRVGRVDRIGSPNDSFGVLNFWPTDNINEYLNLEDRIVDRLVAVRLTGAEVNNDLIDRLSERMINDNTDENQKRKLLEQMTQSIEDIEDSKSFGFSDLTLDIFRQELNASIRLDAKKWERIPKGSFSGFKITNSDLCPTNGVIALMGYPARNKTNQSHAFKTFKLIYLDEQGKLVDDSQIKTLTALSTHFKEKRNVPEKVDKRDLDELNKYSSMFETYFNNLNNTESDEYTKVKVEAMKGLKSGSVIAKMKENDSEHGLEELLKKENYELIAWMIVKE